jgi:hypothetical protein
LSNLEPTKKGRFFVKIVQFLCLSDSSDYSDYGSRVGNSEKLSDSSDFQAKIFKNPATPATFRFLRKTENFRSKKFKSGKIPEIFH